MLGLGKIGSRIAQRAARGFDMEIGYHNRAAVAGSPYRYFASLLELATWADFLVAAAPGGAGTRHLVNADVLAALGPHGYLVDVGRGTVVDTQALIEALRAKRIAGAGLDVLEGEPSVPPLLPELLQCDDVVITPHVAGRAPESRDRGNRVDSRQPERAFCRQAAPLSGLNQGLISTVALPSDRRGGREPHDMGPGVVTSGGAPQPTWTSA